MPDTVHGLPLTSTIVPEDQPALVEAVRSAFAAKTPVYTIGGGTALDYGLPAKAPGIGLSTAALNRVIDYPARDMTITIEAGVTMAALAEMLAAEGQQLPIDAPLPERATLGGVIATNWSGPRRYGHGTIRDYVIGISAVDGRGVAFRAGGRVVKNVAGYDFCKLLTGSLGTLAVITQVTLKVKPIPEARAAEARYVNEKSLAEDSSIPVRRSLATPVAVELMGGNQWAPQPHDDVTLVGWDYITFFEGTRQEVDWMLDEHHDLKKLRGEARVVTAEEKIDAMYASLIAAPADVAPLFVRFAVLPSRLNSILQGVPRINNKICFQGHVGNGILNVGFYNIQPEDIAPLIRDELQPLAAQAKGSVTVLHCPGVELSRELVWGPPRSDHRVMQAVKEQFDPAHILNPGRFVY